MPVGVAVSDIVADYRGRLEQAAALPVEALELQPELDTWQPYPLGRAFRFLAVHAPSQGRDIASPDDEHRAFAVSEVKRGMEFAHVVGADAYLIHPGQVFARENIAGIAVAEGYAYLEDYYWRNPAERSRRADVLEASLRELASFHGRRGFTFDICLENLPFPDLGATFAEYARLYERLAAVSPLLLTLDVPHAFVSWRKLLRHPRLAAAVEGYPAAHASFYGDLRAWLGAFGGAVRYYHVYGATTEREHLPVDPRQDYAEDELDLGRVLPLLGREKPVIVEVFGYPTATLLASARQVEALRGI